MHEQKRRFPRIPSENTVLVTRVGDRGLDRFARTHTVGLGGCGFVSEEDLGEGATVELMISIRPRAIRARARVAYQVPREGGSFDVGVEFIDLTEEERLVLEALFADGEDSVDDST